MIAGRIGSGILGIAIAAVLAGSTTGCYLWDWKRRAEFYTGAPLPAPSAFRDGSLDDGTSQRVLALPFVNKSGHGGPAHVLTLAMNGEIAKLRLFNVVEAYPTDAVLRANDGPKHTGRVDIETVIDLGRRYGVDAVLFGTVDHYRPYSPPAIGWTASLIDVQTGKIVWHVRDYVDASDKAAAIAMREFFDDETAYDQTVMGNDIMSTSPRWFAQFAARRMAETLVAPPAPKSPASPTP